MLKPANDGKTPRNRLLGRRVGLCSVVFVLAGAGWLWIWSTPPACPDSSCPDLGHLDGYRPPEASHLLDRDGELFAHLSGPVRVWVPLEDLPELLPAAVVAVEDRRFFEHSGVDLRSVARAAFVNLRTRAIREGASTITMQLARNLWASALRDTGRWGRKLTEVRLARALEKRMSKEELLELYLNQVYMGSGVYGIGAAALHYFEKPARELTLAEISALVGTIKTPERYNPRADAAKVLARRKVVLGVLAREGLVPDATATIAGAAALALAAEAPARHGGSYYAAAVDRELRRLFPDPRTRQGLRVYTTLDPDVQAAAQQELTRQIERIETGDFGAYSHPVPAGDTAPEGGDYLQGAVTVMDLHTGAVRAVVGGRDWRLSQFDRALQARRQPGSAFKSFVYAAALEDGLTTLAQRVDLSPLEVMTQEGAWTPRESGPSTESMTVRTALAGSSNRAAVRVGISVGLPRVRTLAERLGIHSPIAPYPASLLGASELTPLELTTSYAPFGNGGFTVRPHLITRVEDRSGEVLYRHHPEREQVLDRRVAFLIRSALADVVDRGTGTGVRKSGYRGPAAGKTGTSNGGKDVWFVGFDKTLVASVWLGFDGPRTILPGASGGRLAAPVWGALIARVSTSPSGSDDWSNPPRGVTLRRIDPVSGFVLPDGCQPETPSRIEFFLAGTEPPEHCPVPRLRLAGFELGQLLGQVGERSATLLPASERLVVDESGRDEDDRRPRDGGGS